MTGEGPLAAGTPPAPPLGGAGPGASGGDLTQWEEDGAPRVENEKNKPHTMGEGGARTTRPHWHRAVSNPLGHTAVSPPSGPGPSGFRKHRAGCHACQPGFGSGVLGTLLPLGRINTLGAQAHMLRSPPPPRGPIQFPCDLGPREALRHGDAHPARTPSGLGRPPASSTICSGTEGAGWGLWPPPSRADTWHREGPSCPQRGLATRNVAAPPRRGAPVATRPLLAPSSDTGRPAPASGERRERGQAQRTPASGLLSEAFLLFVGGPDQQRPHRP